jgi:hypothetical protein
MPPSYSSENNDPTKEACSTENSQDRVIPIPAHLKKTKYGFNQYLVLLSYFTPYHLIGLGLLASLFLPTTIIVALSLLLVIYPLVKQIMHYYDYLPTPYSQDIIHPPYSACCDGDFVVFLIGIRPNGTNPFTKSFSEVGKAFRSMIAELESDPTSGYMGGDVYVGANKRKSTVMTVQYWRNYEALQKWTHTKMGTHVRTVLAYMKKDRVEGVNGIWHETYKVRDGEYEAIYAHMPPIGLALATQAVHETKTNNGPERMKRREKERDAQTTTNNCAKD